MRFGIHLRELSRLPVGVLVSATLALLVAVWSVADIGLFPPRVESRSMEIASAHTEVVVDTPESAILDLRQSTYEIEALKNRALLVGNVMASPPVLTHIAQRAGVPPQTLRLVTPRTPAQPRAQSEPDASPGVTDVVAPADQYRLDIQANPTVPVLDVYAQAPTAAAAESLANAAVDGMDDYLAELGASEGTPRNLQVELRQLGRADGHVLNEGIDLEVALLTFFLVFAISCAGTIAISRIRRGWAMTADPGRA